MRIYIVEDDVSVISILEDIVEREGLGKLCGDTGEAGPNLEEILAVPGVDGIICGLNDLSASINKFGQVWDPEMIDLMNQIMDKCKKAGKPFGASLGMNYEMAKYWIDRGASFISIGFPQDYYMMVGREVIGNIRKIESERPDTK